MSNRNQKPAGQLSFDCVANKPTRCSLTVKRRILFCVIIVILLNLIVPIVYLLWPWRNIVPAHINDCEYNYQTKFPPKMHRLWWEGQVPSKYQHYIRHCQALNPHYETIQWNQTGVNDLLKRYYPWALKLFNQYSLPMNRFDAAKYFIIHLYGGVYLDMDMDCVKPFDDIIEATGKVDDVILGESFPFGVVSNFFMAKPAHPFFKQVIHNLANTKDEVFFVSLYETFLRTGPIFIWKNYVNYPCKERMSVLDKYLIRWDWLIHDGKGQWAKTDGAVVLFVANNLAWFLFSTSSLQYVIFFLFLAAVFLIRHISRKRKTPV